MTSPKFRTISVDIRSLYLLQVTFHLLHRDSVGRESLNRDAKQINHQQNEQLPLGTDLKTLNTKTTCCNGEKSPVLGQAQNEAGFNLLMGTHSSPS